MNAITGDLFAIPARRVETPIARRSDPESSHRAAEHHTRSGKRGAQQDQAAAAVRQFPGCTSFELAMRTHLDRYMLARRLPECEAAGRVRRGTQRTCGITGRPAMKFGDEWEAITVAAHAHADCIIRGVLVRFVERAA